MPPKGKRTTSGAEDAFLFVNEDFSTLFGGAKNADLDRSKQSHVQRQSFAKRRQSRRGSRIASSSTSPTPSEDAQEPITGGSLATLRSQSDNRMPLLPLPASNSLWLPLVPDENQNTATAEIQPLSSFEESQLPYWRPSESHFPRQSPYPLQQLGETSSSRSQLDARFASPPPALPMSSEAFVEPDDAFTLSPVASTSPDNPFNNIQVALEKWAPPLMRYYTMKMLPEFFYTDLRATSLQNMRHVEYLHQDMRSCMSNPAEMYALLAASSCHALGRGGQLDLPDVAPKDLHRVTLLFKSKAFEALRLRLSSGDLSQGTVLAIQRLICAARYVSNSSAVEAHYSAATSMIKTIGGLETFNDFQKERLIMHDLFNALKTGSPPRMEVTWDPGELVADVNLELVIYMKHQNVNPGQRIRSIVENSETALHPVVAKCIPELVETQNVLEWLRERPYRPAEYRWLAHRRLANTHQLLNVDRNSSMGSIEVVRLALLCYCIMVMAIQDSNYVLVDQYVIPELGQWQARVMEDTFGSCVDLLLWIMVMFGIGIARQAMHAMSPNKTGAQRSSPQKQGSRRGSGEAQDFNASVFVAGVGMRACKTLGIRTEAQLRGLMRTFLFDDDFVDDRYLTFATEGLCLQQ